MRKLRFQSFVAAIEQLQQVVVPLFVKAIQSALIGFAVEDIRCENSFQDLFLSAEAIFFTHKPTKIADKMRKNALKRLSFKTFGRQ